MLVLMLMLFKMMIAHTVIQYVMVRVAKSDLNSTEQYFATKN